MAVESGREYNPETAADLRPRDFAFESCGLQFRYRLEIPEYILARLDSAVMDQLYDYMRGYASTVVTDALKGGYFNSDSGRKRMTTDVGLHLKNYIWERFSISQEKAGQGCWQVAPSLQKVHAV